LSKCQARQAQKQENEKLVVQLQRAHEAGYQHTPYFLRSLPANSDTVSVLRVAKRKWTGSQRRQQNGARNFWPTLPQETSVDAIMPKVRFHTACVKPWFGFARVFSRNDLRRNQLEAATSKEQVESDHSLQPVVMCE
jgi:hypothetical protein